MKKFRFALDGLVRVREHQVREQERKVAEVAQVHQGAAQELDAKKQLLRQTQQEVPLGKLVEASHLWELERDRQQIRQEMLRDEEKLALWASRLEEERVELQLASKKKEAVEKLRERRYLEFVREVIREEQREHDEIAARIHSQREAA